MLNKKITVVGGHGYLGEHVTKFFGADAFSRKNNFDITKPEDVEILGKYDVIINMTASLDKSNSNIEKVFETNAKGTENIVKNLNQNQIFIFTSTKEVHSPENAYGFSKIVAENYARAYAKSNGFRLGIFRLSSTYAPTFGKGSFVNYFVKSIQEGKTLELMMRGQQQRDFLYVDDLSEAFEAFINSNIKEGIYEIGGGKENSTTILGLTEIIEKLVDKKANIKFVDGTPAGEINYTTDLTKIKKELDWTPKVTLKEGLKKVIL